MHKVEVHFFTIVSLPLIDGQPQEREREKERRNALLTARRCSLTRFSFESFLKKKKTKNQLRKDIPIRHASSKPIKQMRGNTII